MSDARLRRLERDYQAAPTESRLITLLTAKVRAGLLSDRRALALVTKPPVRCWLFTATKPSFGLEVQPAALRPRPYPELGGEWEFLLPAGSRGDLNGLQVILVTFEDAATGERLGVKNLSDAPHCPLTLTPEHEYRFTWQFTGGGADEETTT